MVLFKNIFASIYFYYKDKKNEDARFNAILGVLMLIIFGLLILDILLEIFFEIGLSFFQHSKYWMVSIWLLLFYLLSRLYNKNKVAKIMEEFEGKSMAKKKAWLGASVMLFFVLLIATIILIQIKHGIIVIK